MNASILLYRSAALIDQGEWASAIIAAEAVLAVSHRSRARMQSRTGRAQEAYARWHLTRERAHVDELEQVARQFRTGNNSRQHVSMVFGWVVEVMTEHDEAETARIYMGEVIRRVREAGDRLGEAMGWRAMARSAQASGSSARADRYLRFAKCSADLRLSQGEAAHNLLCEADLLSARGHNRQAQARRVIAGSVFERLDMPYYRNRALTNR
ncbi:MAG: hypothetical protein CGW95_03830 [Phenylobacterium zucineum]|nr:MAG: hypothetical protein CGW95_03830 [Phenylobacterium zucineum]